MQKVTATTDRTNGADIKYIFNDNSKHWRTSLDNPRSRKNAWVHYMYCMLKSQEL
jgi:hypothetical protein